MPRLALLAALAVAVVLCGVVAPTASAAPASKLFVVTAAGGTLAPRDATHFDLTLRGVAPHATWFTDRPARQAGTLTVGAFAAGWAGFGFAADPPNAAIELAGGPSGADTLVVELDRPRYDRARRTLRLRVRRVRAGTATLGGHERRADARIPRRFGSVSLFVDGATAARSIGVTVLNASSTPLMVVYGTLTGGSWTSPPLPGTDIAPGGSLTLENGASSVFSPLGGTLLLTPASGGTVSAQWSWSPGSAPGASAAIQSAAGVSAMTWLSGTQTSTPSLHVVVADAAG